MTRSLCLSAVALPLLVGVAGLCSGSSSSAQEKFKGVAVGNPPVKWEYKVSAPANWAETLEKELNDLGADGWEVAGTAREGYT